MLRGLCVLVRRSLTTDLAQDDSDSESDLPGPSNGAAPATQREDLVDARLDVAEARSKFRGKTAAGGGTCDDCSLHCPVLALVSSGYVDCSDRD